LQPGRHVGRIAQGELFLMAPTAHLPYHHQAGMDARSDSQTEASLPFKSFIQRPHGVEQAQSCPHGVLCIVLMGLPPAKIDQ
jgi:hypothetical protein